MPTNLIEVTDADGSVAYLLSLNTVKYFVENSNGNSTVFTPIRILQDDVEEDLDTIVPLSASDLAKLTEKGTGRLLAVNRRRVHKVVKNTDNTATIVFDDSTTVVVDELYSAVKAIFTATPGGGASSVSTDATIDGDGSVGSPLGIADTAVTPGPYTNADLTVDQQGRIVAIANGSAASGTVSRDSLSSGTVTAEVGRIGGSATTISNPASGEYDLDIKAGGEMAFASVYGNNSTLNGSNEFIVRIDNSANSADRRVSIQLYDQNTGALVDQQATGTVHTVAVAGNVTTITIPGVNGFGAAGFYVEIR